MTDHLHADLDALADVLAGERDGTDLTGCATCSAALADLEQASAAVAAELEALPVPALPDDLLSRLDAALVEAVLDGVEPAASVTTLPQLPSRAPSASRRWLPAAAAAVVLVGGVGLGLSTLSSGSDDATTSGVAADAGGGSLADLVRNDTGSSYDPANLAGAVPALLAGDATTLRAPLTAGAPAAGGTGSTGSGAPLDVSTQSRSSAESADATLFAAQDLGRLRTPEGLADCLVALLPPDDESVQPLALDYGEFVVDGVAQPALVVILPVPRRADKVDVFVVGAGCAQTDEQLLHFARVDRP